MGNPDKDSYWETVAGIRKSYHQIPGVSREKLIVMHASSLRRRSNLTLVSNVREAPGGGGVLAEKLGRGVWPASQNPYPIYDQNLRFSLPYL